MDALEKRLKKRRKIFDKFFKSVNHHFFVTDKNYLKLMKLNRELDGLVQRGGVITRTFDISQNVDTLKDASSLIIDVSGFTYDASGVKSSADVFKTDISGIILDGKDFEVDVSGIITKSDGTAMDISGFKGILLDVSSSKLSKNPQIYVEKDKLKTGSHIFDKIKVNFNDVFESNNVKDVSGIDLDDNKLKYDASNNIVDVYGIVVDASDNSFRYEIDTSGCVKKNSVNIAKALGINLGGNKIDISGTKLDISGIENNFSIDISGDLVDISNNKIGKASGVMFDISGNFNFSSTQSPPSRRRRQQGGSSSLLTDLKNLRDELKEYHKNKKKPKRVYKTTVTKLKNKTYFIKK